MKRGQVGVPTFVYAIGILIVLVAFLFMVPSFKELLFEAGEKGECQWSVLVSALTRTPGLGFENIPVECKAKYIDVSLEDLQDNYAAASQAIMKYKAETTDNNHAYDEIYKKFNNPNSEAQLAEWSANKIVADQMVDCWDKVWKGELPLFDVWHKLIAYENVVSKKELGDIKSGADAIKQGVGTVSPMLSNILNFLPVNTVVDWTDKLLNSDQKDWSEIDYLKFWNLKYQRPPVFCVVCSRINFKKDTESALTNLQIDLTEWLKINQVPMTKESYTEYIISDELKGYNHYYKYDTTKPVAIVYTRVNTHQMAAVTEDVADFLGMNPNDPAPNKANKLAVVPYDKVIMPFKKGGTSCDYVLD